MKTPCLSFVLVALLAATSLAQKPDAKKPAATPAPESADAKVRDVTPEDVEKLLKEQKDVVVLDVRTPEEFDMGHLAGAKNFSVLDLEFAQQVAAVEGKPIVLHCASGSRSARALQVLRTKTFPMIYHMSGGYKAWVDAGKPVVSSAP